VIRILHIVGTASSDGTTKQLALLGGTLSKAEFDLQVCSLDAKNVLSHEWRRSEIEPVVIGRRGVVDPLAFCRLQSHIRRLRPDIVHTWQFDAGVYGRLAALSVGIERLVTSECCVDIGRTDLEWSLSRWLALRTACIVTNSGMVKAFCIARGGLPPGKLFVIPNSTAPAELSRLARSDFLAQHRLPGDAKLLVYLGPLVKEKRLKELIWATDQLKAVAVPAHLLIVGDGPLRPALERYRRQNRIDDRVHLLGRCEDVSEILAHADVLWQAGAYEGQSIAILEAMAAGVPVVAADAAGNRELVINGETGYLVPVKERAGFARWTLPLLEDAELSKQFGTAARLRVEQCHRVEDMANRYAELYRAIYSQPRFLV
jgi:glycosyltransferase involved in cell wall biosynthesis